MSSNLNLTSEMIRVPRGELNALIIREAAQRKALKKVLKFVNATSGILSAHNFEGANTMVLIAKMPSIINEFKNNQELFKDVMNPEFMNELKELTNEISG